MTDKKWFQKVKRVPPHPILFCEEPSNIQNGSGDLEECYLAPFFFCKEP
jgi:hypothetical protein